MYHYGMGGSLALYVSLECALMVVQGEVLYPVFLAGYFLRLREGSGWRERIGLGGGGELCYPHHE